MALNVALVGIGKIARDQHIPALARNPELELVATVSRNATVGGVENFTHIDELLTARPDVDIVSLAIPPQPRFAYASAALAAGKHVMLEKPPGASLSECYALKELAKAKGVSLYATWHSRAADCVPTAKNWLVGKKLEKVEIIWKEDVRRWHPGQEWIWQAGGLGVFDPGINALSILTEILPEPVHLNSAVLEFPENRGTPIAASLNFSHPKGAEVTGVFDWRQEGDQNWDIRVATSEGDLLLTEGGAKLSIDGELKQDSADNEYPNLYARMAELVPSAQIDMDLSPLLHVADAFMLGERKTVAPFHW